MSTGNPQGKGRVAILEQWQAAKPCQPERKSAQRIGEDLLVSMLVLSARFSFKPVVGQSYYLYFQPEHQASSGHWVLSLIEPQCAGDRLGEFYARTRLRADMTWQLEGKNPTPPSLALQEVLQDFIANMGQHFGGKHTLLEQLPFFVETLPFYQRLAASALAKSIAHSATPALLTSHNGSQDLFSPLALPGLTGVE